MWFKTVLAYFLIILDVMIFPFSCAGNSNKNKCIFVIMSLDENQYYVQDEIIKAIPKDGIIESAYPFELDESKSKILGWIIYHNEDLSKDTFTPEFISFPYTIQEEDYLPYFCGKRNSVVIAAIVENYENATA